MSGEKPGKTIVKFNRKEGDAIVGEVAGDRRPVYVNKKSLKPSLGDIWECHLNTTMMSGQECWLAILEERKGFEEPEKAPEEEYTIDEPKEAPAEEAESLEEDEYKIVEDPKAKAWRELRARMSARPSHYSKMDEDDEEDDEDEESEFVCYEGNGVLFSNLLVFDRYMAFRSSNDRVIQLAPCREGGFRCVGGRVRIGMLDRILGDRTGCQLEFEKDDGILTVYLDSE